MLQRGTTYFLSISTGTASTGAFTLLDNFGSTYALQPNERVIITELGGIVPAGSTALVFQSSTSTTYPVIALNATSGYFHTDYEGIACLRGQYPWLVLNAGTNVILTGTCYVTQDGGWTSYPTWRPSLANNAVINN